MMLASIQSEIDQVLGVFGFIFGFGVGLLFLLARLVGRQIKKGYQEEGGATGMAKKVAAKGAGKVLRPVVLRR